MLSNVKINVRFSGTAACVPEACVPLVPFAPEFLVRELSLTELREMCFATQGLVQRPTLVASKEVGPFAGCVAPSTVSKAPALSKRRAEMSSLPIIKLEGW